MTHACRNYNDVMIKHSITVCNYILCYTKVINVYTGCQFNCCLLSYMYNKSTCTGCVALCISLVLVNISGGLHCKLCIHVFLLTVTSSNCVMKVHMPN